jgi:flavin-binding protein dodecin
VVALLLMGCNGDATLGDADEAAIDKAARSLDDKANAEVNQQIAEIEATANQTSAEGGQ